ncbi:MAG: DUF808 family protein [Rothia aeria]
MQLVVLIVVAFVVTAMVYGAVAVLVKMDDVAHRPLSQLGSDISNSRGNPHQHADGAGTQY